MKYLTLGLLLISLNVLSEPEVLTIESTITGSQEQPKVLYIVPWKPPEGPGDLYQPILGNVIEEQVLQPIDRDTFRRQVDYYGRLNQQAINVNPQK